MLSNSGPGRRIRATSGRLACLEIADMVTCSVVLLRCEKSETLNAAYESFSDEAVICAELIACQTDCESRNMKAVRLLFLQGPA